MDDEQTMTTDNAHLRRLLSLVYAGASLYTDDGELSDSREHPHIDFKRDSVAEIEAKMRTRAAARGNESRESPY